MIEKRYVIKTNQGWLDFPQNNTVPKNHILDAHMFSNFQEVRDVYLGLFDTSAKIYVLEPNGEFTFELREISSEYSFFVEAIEQVFKYYADRIMKNDAVKHDLKGMIEYLVLTYFKG